MSDSYSDIFIEHERQVAREWWKTIGPAEQSTWLRRHFALGFNAFMRTDIIELWAYDEHNRINKET